MAKTGKIKWFREAKGFGFITASDGTEIFVHKNSINDGTLLSELVEGCPVTFEVVDSAKGPRAENVRKPDGPAAPRRTFFEELNNQVRRWENEAEMDHRMHTVFDFVRWVENHQ